MLAQLNQDIDMKENYLRELKQINKKKRAPMIRESLHLFKMASQESSVPFNPVELPAFDGGD